MSKELEVFMLVTAYMLIGILMVRPSKAVHNLANPCVGDVAPVVVFWPLYLLMRAMFIRIPKRWIVPPATPPKMYYCECNKCGTEATCYPGEPCPFALIDPSCKNAYMVPMDIDL